jgi:hypothetical protein
MKASVLTFFVTATLATARVVPCGRGTTNVDSFAEHDVTMVTTNHACYGVCWPTARRCGGSWAPVKIGKCWTCCKGRLFHEFEEGEFEGVDEFDDSELD